MAVYQHQPVLLDEVITGLEPHVGGRYIDVTLGGGGYTAALLERIGSAGHILALDADTAALVAAQDRLNNDARIQFVQANFRDVADVVERAGWTGSVDGIMADLGLSSGQLDAGERGFSFRQTAPLDMRFDQRQGQTAADIIATQSARELSQLFRQYGEEPLAGLIAAAIVRQRDRQPVTTTTELVELVSQLYQRKYHRPSKIHPATRVFQALRIAVNNEMESLERLLAAAVTILKPGGRVAIVSYHSLEDRLVKQFFNQAARTCICPPEVPLCQCHYQPPLRIITKKPIVPAAAELEKNPRSRSAKLRIAEKLIQTSQK